MRRVAFLSHPHDVDDSFAAATRQVIGDDECDRIHDADVLVLIVGFAYDETESRFLAAGEYGIPRLVFLVDQAMATEVDARQAGFRTRLLDSGAVTAVVGSPDALSSAVAASLDALRSIAFRRVVRKLPPPPRNVVGRETEMARLREVLSPDRHEAFVEITGEVGAGKTELARAFVHQYADEYEVVWWVPAQPMPLVEASLRTLQSMTQSQVPRSLLLILNDVPERLSPGVRAGRVHTIVTDREPHQGNSVQLGAPPDPAGPASWSTALERLEDTARQLVTLSAWIAPTALSISLLTAHASLLPPPLRDPEALAAAAAALREADLASVDTDTITLPTLLADWLRERTIAEEPRPGGWLAVAVELLSHADPGSWHGQALRAAVADITANDRPTGPNPAVVGQLLDHLVFQGFSSMPRLRENATRYLRAPVAAFEREAVERLREEGAPTRTTAALRLLGRFEEARIEDEVLLAELRRTLGDDHPDTLAQSVSLATTHGDLGDHRHGIELAEEAVNDAGRALGEDHPVTLAATLTLAGLLRETGDHERAGLLDADVLGRCERLLGPHHPRTLQAATALASDLAGQGEHERARDLNRRTLERYNRVLGEDHPDTLACAVNLTADYADLGDLEQACDLGARTLLRYRRVLGDDHPDTLLCHANLDHDLAERRRRAATGSGRRGSVTSQLRERAREKREQPYGYPPADENPPVSGFHATPDSPVTPVTNTGGVVHEPRTDDSTRGPGR